MLHFLFYMLPMLGAFIYGLVVPGCTWMPDWTVFVAGGVAQVRYGGDIFLLLFVNNIDYSSHNVMCSTYRASTYCYY